jgi:hypothetical protein
MANVVRKLTLLRQSDPSKPRLLNWRAGVQENLEVLYLSRSAQPWCSHVKIVEFQPDAFGLLMKAFADVFELVGVDAVGTSP